MGFEPFTPADAADAIHKYCNSDTYTSTPSLNASAYGVPVVGWDGMDRFWYKHGTYCMTTAPRPKPPNIPKDQSACHADGNMDYEIDVGVSFKSDQRGCQPAKQYPVPRGQPCVNMLSKVTSGC